MPNGKGLPDILLRSARRMSEAVERLSFKSPVTHVYNPLTYAWAPFELYLRRFATGKKRVVFLGMNPGPFGMVQTGVPFGEVSAVRDWLQLEAHVARPAREHPSRRITGFDCSRSEISGRRLWGLFSERFGTPQMFFHDHIVINYCPLAFIERSGRNRTPDKLPAVEKTSLFAICDAHLELLISALDPEWLIGIGHFAFERAEKAISGVKPKRGKILHPSPANPAANRDWSRIVAKQLAELGVWDDP